MKKYIIYSAIAVLTANVSNAMTEVPDTLMLIDTPSNLIITESPDGITVNVSDLETESKHESIVIADYNNTQTVSTNQHTSKFVEFTLNKGAASISTGGKWSAISGGFNIGLVNASGQPDNLGMQWSKSFELSWLNALAIRYSYKTVSVSLGIGFDWRNYKMTTSNHYMKRTDENRIVLDEYPEGTKPGGSRIKVFSLGFPLLYTQRIPGTTLALTAGGIFNINTHASLLSVYENSEGNKIEEYSEGIGKRRVSFDVYGAVTFFNGCGIYIRYSPQSVLTRPMSPKFKPLSIGITLFM